MTGDRLSYNLIYSVVFVLLSSAGFGRLHYEHVESAFGGGEPRVVEILIDRQEIRDGLKDMDVDVTPILKGKLVHETQRELVIDVGEQTIRLSKDVVAGVRVVPVEDVHWLFRIFGAPQENGEE